MTRPKESRTETSGMLLRPKVSSDSGVFLPFFIFIHEMLSASYVLLSINRQSYILLYYS